jgi:hypothetical protein
MVNVQIKKPVIIIGAPRSGTSLLLTVLSNSKELWSQYRETIDIWERFYSFSEIEFKNDQLTESDLNTSNKEFLLNEFHKFTFNNYYLGSFVRQYSLNNEVLLDFIGQENLIFKSLFVQNYRIIEKSPKTCFRIPFINKLFPDCKFIFLKRDGRSNINSLIEGWKRSEKYRRKEVKNWSFILPPEWENYRKHSVEEIAAFQWAESNKAAMNSLNSIEDKRKYILKYEDLIENPAKYIKEMADFIDIPLCSGLNKFSKKLPEVNYISKPDKEKWKKNIHLIEKTYPVIEPVMKEMGYLLK